MITAILIAFAYGLLGTLIYYVWKAKAYIITGTFDYTKWKAENLHKLLYSIVMLILVITLFLVAPETLDVIRKTIGISFDVGKDAPQDQSPIFLGFAVAAFTYSTIKAKNTIERNKKEVLE